MSHSYIYHESMKQQRGEVLHILSFEEMNGPLHTSTISILKAVPRIPTG